MILLGITLSFFTSCNNAKNDALVVQNDLKTETPNTSVERGKYLVTLMDCNTCHTPNIMTDQGPKPDMSRMLSGYPSERPTPEFDGQIVSKGALFPHPDLTASMGPWGVSFAGNLTPDATGIGNWSFAQFSKAMKEGKFKGLAGSRPMLPPMPWRSYASLTDNDLEAIYNYLKSIPAIENLVPTAIPPQSN